MLDRTSQPDPSRTDVSRRHLRVLRRAAAISRLLTGFLALLAAQLPLFDSSPRAVLTGPLDSVSSTLLRWDAFHFAHIARDGYVYEHDWAFLPGTPGLMRLFGAFTRVGKDIALGRKTTTPLDWLDLLQGGALAAMACETSGVMYELSLHHLGSPALAYVASLLSLLPSSPATLHMAPYSEPFFAYLSYKGMLMCARSQWLLATCYFASASIFRSNGILLAGFLLWGLIVQPALETRRINTLKSIYGILLSLVSVAPFATHQYMAYRAFCLQTETPRAEWCTNFPPSIYAHVQSRYWNSGFLKYWTLPQVPNFILCAPVLALLLGFSAYHIKLVMPRLISDVRALVPFRSDSKISPPSNIATPFARRQLTPHAIHALIFSGILLFASHTQIALRMAASMPITYWAAAWLLVERPALGKWWVWWSVVWGAVSVVLWVVFLPPA